MCVPISLLLLHSVLHCSCHIVLHPVSWESQNFGRHTTWPIMKCIGYTMGLLSYDWYHACSSKFTLSSPVSSTASASTTSSVVGSYGDFTFPKSASGTPASVGASSGSLLCLLELEKGLMSVGGTFPPTCIRGLICYSSNISGCFVASSRFWKSVLPYFWIRNIWVPSNDR